MKKITIISVPVLIIIAIIFLAFDWHFPKATSQYREPNRYDYFYEYVALVNGRPEFCERISPFAYTVAPWNSGSGSKVELEQSSCFRELALNIWHPDYCDKVRPINTWLYGGYDFTASKCRAEVAIESSRKKVDSLGLMPYSGSFNDINEQKAFLKELGYDYVTDPDYQKSLAQYKSNIVEYNKSHPDQPENSSEQIIEDSIFGDYWSRISRTDDFIRRAAQLPKNN